MDRAPEATEPGPTEVPWQQRHDRPLRSSPDPVPEDSVVMDRAQAIAHVWGLHYSHVSEFCVGAEENREADKETRAALLALGVDEFEL